MVGYDKNELKQASMAGVDRLPFLDKGLCPGENASPTLAVALGLLGVAGESAVANLHERAGTGALRTARVQAMHALRFKFPAHGGLRSPP